MMHGPTHIKVIGIFCCASSVTDEQFKEDEIGGECSTHTPLRMLQHGMKGSSACLIAFATQNQSLSVLRQPQRMSICQRAVSVATLTE